MKKNIFIYLAIGAMSLGMVSCGEDFLTVGSSEKLEAGAPATVQAIEQSLASAYQILLFDSYANGNYNSITLLGDLRSDDLFKGGGDANDQASLYFLSQFANTPSDVPAGWWSIYFTGLSRTNGVILSCENAVDGTEEEINRLAAEAHTLRAYYVHLLWKFWGNIPYYEGDLPDPYFALQYTADEVYKEIMEDLDFALDGNKLPTTYNATTYGRVTKPTAQMLRARVAMYQNDQSRYNQVLADMVEIINNPAYYLMEDFDGIFLSTGEFCPESIFEVNHLPEGKDWSSSWGGYGTNLPAFISPNSFTDPSGEFIGGWGFGPVRKEAYEMYAAADQRRDASINDWRNADYAHRFQNTGFFMRKYAARPECNVVIAGAKDLNFDNNLRIFRLSEAYLNAAELVVGGASASGAQSAQYYLDAVRKRAFGGSFEQYKVTATLDNIKKERRLEFLGEGLRYWDLVRWGDAAKVLTENLPEYSSNRTWDPTKSKYVPIPQDEIDKTKGYGEFELKQNPY
ncbi:RagB/SusD family nutrient uptake outer membrane protein [Parabacteroides sp. OttesenSCG-928-N08]|nr:RagB/SusD family nutrient uptake outer membrane protein [Parabacteroides sp. OttesenSCG-928-N08]